MAKRVLFIGGTGPVGQASIPHLLDAGNVVAVAHTGAHEAPALDVVEHLHGSRHDLLARDGPAERWRPDAIVDTFPGGATADKGSELSDLVDRLGRAVAAALERAPEGRFACNVGDPRDLSYAALAQLVAERLDWEWKPYPVAWADGDHPWNVRYPVLCDTTRLRETLGVTEPDPIEATLRQIDWLWEHRAELAQL